MFNWVRKLFGSGYIYFDLIFTNGHVRTGRMKYTGDKDTVDIEEVSEKIKALARFEGYLVKDVVNFKIIPD